MKIVILPSLLLLSLLCVSFPSNVLSQCSIYEDFPITIFNNTNYVVNKPFVYRIGMGGSWAGTMDNAVVMLSAMIDLVNNSTDILDDIRLELYVADFSSGDSAAYQGTNSLLFTHKADIIIGGFTTIEARIAQIISKVVGVPQILNAAADAAFANKLDYPNSMRVVPNDILQAQAIVNYIHSQGWTQFFVCYDDQVGGSSALEMVTSIANSYNITIHSLKWDKGQSASDYVSNVKALLVRSRLRIILDFLWILPSVQLFPEFLAQGLLQNSKYTHILISNTASYAAIIPGFTDLLGGSIGVTAMGGHGPVHDALAAMWDSRSNIPGWLPFQLVSGNMFNGDSIMGVANALANLRKSGHQFSEINGNLMLEEMTNITYQGYTGKVVIENLERKGDFIFSSYVTVGNTTNPQQFGIYSAIEESLDFSANPTYFGGLASVSDGKCPCLYGQCEGDTDTCICIGGYSGSNCQTKNPDSFGTSSIIIVTIVPTVIVLLVALGAYRYVSVKRANAIKEVSEKQQSVIRRSDIEFNHVVGRGASGVVFRGMFRGTEVAVKRIMANDVSKAVIEEFQLESAVMAGLRHPNIVLFMGSCIVAEEKEMLLVMEFMEKGSLHDILHNSKVNFPFELALHIAGQAAKGMNFLHQANPPIIHRDLKSHNILLDDKWNARIADFGISRFKAISNNKKYQGNENNNSLGTVYWAAPEVFLAKPHTEKSDCYSFGVVMWELVHRATPYGNKDPMAVANDVANNGSRPAITATVPKPYLDLMVSCWDDNPVKRPTFAEISQEIRFLSLKYPLVNFSAHDAHSVAPSGLVHFVHTDVFGGNSLWDQIPEPMRKAIMMHNQVLRSALSAYEGYEIEFNNNGFLLAFSDLANAVNYCIGIQISLLNVPWPEEICQNHLGTKVYDGNGNLIWNGLRTRMAIHGGVPTISDDIGDGKKIYSGAAVDAVQKILKASPSDSCIVASASVVEKFSSKIKFTEEIHTVACGSLAESSRSKSESMYSILPASLSARSKRSPFAAEPSLTLNTIEVDDEDDGVVSFSFAQEEISWLVSKEKLSVRESVGKGSIGDYYRAIWNGKEVVIKVLINQKLQEPDLLHLKAKMAVLSHIAHPNLVQNFGVCLEPGNIALVQESMIKFTPLRQLLSNDAIPLSVSTKLSIAKQIADGMSFLARQSDPYIHTFGNLKSGNIFVNVERGETKITDFGQGNLKDLARTMTSIGTVSWTAPEILNGEDVTPAVSVYAFGIILYEIASRKVPYLNEHPVRLVSKILCNFRPTPPSDCPPALKSLMEQCWNGEPSSRPTWHAIAEQLGQMA